MIGVPNGVAPLDGDGLIPEEFLPEISSAPGTPDEAIQYNDGGVFAGDAGFTYNKTTNVATIGGVILSSQTASRLAIFDSSKNIVSADTATYPSLSELAFVKGVSGAIQTQLGNKQATLVSGTNIKTINGVTLLGSGDIAISASPAGSNTQIQYNNSGAFGANSLFTFNGTALGVGVASPLATVFHGVNPTASYTTITGTVSFANVVFVGNVTGTGTLFTTEFKVGDFLVHPTQDAQKAMVLRIVSNTSMQILTMNALFISGSGTGYRRLDRTNAVIDTSGTTISTESY